MCVVGVQPTYLIFQPHWYLSVTKPSHRSPKCMVFILGASSLDHALRKRPAPSQKRVKDEAKDLIYEARFKFEL